MGTIYDKFVNSLARLSKTGYRLPSRVALALSGGVDSVVLLNLLVRYKREIRPDLEIHALTVDHGLRAESTHEARRLQQVVLGEMAYPVAHEVLTIRTPISRRQVERHARDLRYGLLYAYCEQRGIRSVFMGHHLDDQLETYVMRLLSNSTLFGLAGIRPLAPGNLHGRHAVDLVRPLLGVTKADIYGHARAQSLTWFEDRTNADAGLTARNQLDTQLMSLTLRIGVRWEHFRAGLGPIDFLAMDRWIFNQVWLISPSRKYLYGYTKFDSNVLYDNRLFIIVGGSSKGARKAAVATDLQDLQCSHELKVQNFNMAQHSVADSLTRQLMLALGLDPELGPDWDLTFRPNWTAGSSKSVKRQMHKLTIRRP
ncbi:hypothetical protein PICMEDRAFT_73928 [Pichia membranifaciens NRRL Y-2026]|uniref:tRNA(Ile)-lysidine synthetase n=1 Tax=Pichia membranifaciens NRRL Y-2026 TaxID=763406 RepID=A0A1E3NG79_9ASCO|nr:hypothetical protein PICMEDRAFT_73928 [Pichia membranifaciens NRRL Y-2026]ODQ45150.1 hypothetical protein PICMEDRAFT_73928 [Pichia membranifaciens NRRL Y-2026]